MASLSSLKDLKRRGMQTILQQMGIAGKTQDDSISQVFQSFTTLGNFITHLTESVQGTSTAMDKMAKSQGNLASSLQAYVHSELADASEAPSGELAEFFSSQDEEASVHSVMLQEVSERFYYACNDIANTVFQDMVLAIDELVLKPIARDEEQNTITKELNNERKKLNLDYDAYRRAHSANPVEQERNDAKVRAAKERFEACSKKFNDHLAVRNYKRSRLIIHSILSLIQQYNKFFIGSAALLQDVTGLLTPLLEHYQMDERQLMDLLRMETLPPKAPVKDGASVPPGAKPKRESPPPSPKQQKAAPVPNPKPQQSVRAQPPSPSLPKENGHSNGAPAPTKAAPLFADLMGDGPSSVPTPQPATATPTPAPAPAPSPNLIDPWGDIPNIPSSATPTSNNSTGTSTSSKNDAPFVDISFDTTPPPVNNAPQPTPSATPVYSDPFDIFGQTPLQPSSTSPKPTPASNFNIPQQPQPSTFKPGPAVFPGQNPQQQPKPTYVPPTYKQPFYPPPYGTGSVPPFGAGSVPPGARPGFTPSGGPPNGNPYTNPPNAGFFVQQETDGLDSTTAGKLRQWAEKGGKKQNLRSLLSTINDVLWPDSGWEPKGLGALVAPDQVKKAYRQATLIVHPDKVANCTEEQKTIAKRIFETLRESYDVFKNEPQ